MVPMDNSSPLPVLNHRKPVYDYYGLVFDTSGCPMKKTDRGLVFHPILAPYLIVDYTSEFEKTGNKSFLDYARQVASHALRYAEPLGDALTFIYRPSTGISNVPREFVSGLTQAWYVKAFASIEKLIPGEYSSEIRQFFASLLIPVEKSGVLRKKPFGWVVDEYPNEPAFYTLNGWLTVLRWIVQSRQVLDRFGIQYSEFLDRNLDAVVHLLPMYDAAFCLNSRYQLTGFTRIRLVFDRPVTKKCRCFELQIPGEGIFPGHVNIGGWSRWDNHVERSEPRILQFNVLLSLISKPEENIFRAAIETDLDCTAEVMLAQGSFRPDVSAMPTERWRCIGRLSFTSGQINNVEFSLPFDGEDLFAYPTNFKKKIGGQYFNGYHFVHIVDLAELYAYSRRPLLREMSERWLDYWKRWEALPFLRDGNYSLLPHLYGKEFPAIIGRMLA